VFKEAREQGKKDEMIGNNAWNNLLKKWNMLLY